ncbi:hypothetical protein AGABI1DRAFT_133557 [Agaricus bisporus var. burnettii JB137-S8]|uniref:Uncharacterized protein n=1 Tax=Agaricus bisporus var. burnettii (strain JB137-S8 / ATCC MYA-4627 / FGSC 10392) TaxID=597362 RepID=K5VIL4_AGABU|nr:uncharacterized protein AGABI1DRAFT_133557 [Agaricus bisporus var. burnettii JB137-S8]EKM74164.1 hypothetical protein AGABI1DRAFT_133557 [Agaricus bisporus var. burnettii JB137-S8]
MTSSQPLVCVFLKLPPSHQLNSRIHKIAWNVFLPQLDRLNQALEAAWVAHPSSAAKNIWSEARKSAAEKMNSLLEVAYMNYDTASSFLYFLKSLLIGGGNSGAYKAVLSSARRAVRETVMAQEALLNFREDIRIAVSQITTLMSSGGNDISLFITESSASMLELATAVEECHALLEEHLEGLREVKRQRLDANDNQPSEEEFRMVHEKWLVLKESSGPEAYRWRALRRQMQKLGDNNEPVMTPNNPTSPTMPMDSLRSHKIPFWRKLFRRI